MYLLKIISVQICFGVLLGQFFQDDYNFTHERFEVVSYNVKYIKITVRNFKYNRSIAAVNANITFNKNLSNDLIFDIQGYKFASNEYRLFPITFPYKACSAFKTNDFGVRNIFKCGNLTGCPLSAGSYYVCNWTPDGSHLPPHMPSGKYMFDVKLVQSSEEIARFQWYCSCEKKLHLF